MGVRGWNSLLAREGWLVPRETSDGKERLDSLWMIPRDPHHSSLLLDRLERIPSGSQFHIDGMGLCFHLHAAAYQRNVSSASLSRSGSMHLLRTFVPLQDLHEITMEFIHGLQSAGIHDMAIYWDGSARPRFKAETQSMRQAHRDEEWEVLQTYCRSGGRLPRKGLSRAVPVSPLAMQQIRHSLSSLNLTIVQCEGEADIDMARAVNHHPQRFVVANDTDFCFMESISYIPFSTLHIVQDVVNAIVLRRDRLAEALGFADEALLVEAAILLGNDYYQPVKSMAPSEVIDYLQEQEDDFCVEASNDIDRERLDFIRSLYNLEYTVRVWEDTNANVEFGDNVHPNKGTAKPTYRMSRASLDPIITANRHNRPKHVIIECLERYAEDNPEDLSPEHIQAFIDMDVETQVTLSCPKWDDVVASFVLECTIRHLFRHESFSSDEALYEIYPSAIQFFEALHRNRNLDVASTPSNTFTISPQMDMEAPSVLPVDEFKDKIVDSVRRNRVTIVQGGTGCGTSFCFSVET